MILTIVYKSKPFLRCKNCRHTEGLWIPPKGEPEISYGHISLEVRQLAGLIWSLEKMKDKPLGE